MDRGTSKEFDGTNGRVQQTTVEHGDCVVLMKKMTPSSVHLVLTDPPYNTIGMDLTGNGRNWDAYHLPLGRTDKAKRDALPTTMKAMPFKREQADDLYTGMKPVAEQMLRVLKPGALALVMASPRTSFATAMALHEVGFEVRDLMTWHHNGGQPKAQELNRFNKAIPMNWKTPQPRQQFECVWLARKPSNKTMAATWVESGVGLMNCGELMPCQLLEFSKPGPSERAKRGGHPTTKPVALFLRLLELFIQKGQTVLDPFAGSGTTAEAAMLFGCKAHLMEQDEGYFNNLKEKYK